MKAKTITAVIVLAATTLVLSGCNSASIKQIGGGYGKGKVFKSGGRMMRGGMMRGGMMGGKRR